MVVTELSTVGQIADRLDEPPSRVAYIISKYRLKPRSQVGIIRLFDQDQVQVITDGLFNIGIRHTL